MKRTLLSIALLFCFTIPAYALTCLQNAGVHALEFYELSDADKKKVSTFTHLNAAGTDCRYVLVQEGKPVFAGPYHVQFSELYAAYLSALEARNTAQITELYSNFAPIDRPANRLFELSEIDPPGGLANTELLATVLNYKDTPMASQLERNPHWFIVYLFTAMGGDVIDPTDRHVTLSKDLPRHHHQLVSLTHNRYKLEFLRDRSDVRNNVFVYRIDGVN